MLTATVLWPLPLRRTVWLCVRKAKPYNTAYTALSAAKVSIINNSKHQQTTNKQRTTTDGFRISKMQRLAMVSQLTKPNMETCPTPNNNRREPILNVPSPCPRILSPCLAAVTLGPSSHSLSPSFPWNSPLPLPPSALSLDPSSLSSHRGREGPLPLRHRVLGQGPGTLMDPRPLNGQHPGESPLGCWAKAQGLVERTVGRILYRSLPYKYSCWRPPLYGALRPGTPLTPFFLSM